MAETFPIDAVPVNGWTMELPGMQSPHISKVTGLSRKTGTMEVVDGGTNRKFFFSDGILEHSPITLIRVRDGSAEDKVFDAFFRRVVETGDKIDGTLLQFRNGRPSLKIKFLGMLLNEQSWADMDVESGDKAEMTFVAQLDFMEIAYNEEAG